MVAQALGKNDFVTVRILLDTASSSNFITVSSAKLLKSSLIEENFETNVRTMHGTKKEILRKICITLGKSKHSWQLPIQVYEVKEIGTLPAVTHTNEQIFSRCSGNPTLNENYPRPEVTVDILLGIKCMSLQGNFIR